MKKLSFKFAIAFLALILGIIVVWASGIYQVIFIPSIDLPTPEVTTQQKEIQEKSGEVLLRFKNFEPAKGWIANFEIINETEQTVFYVGSKRKDKFDYCTLAVKRNEETENLSFNTRDVCYYGKFITLQSLEPGESVVLSAWEYEVRSLLAISDKRIDTKTQIGFEVFTGEDKRREILWSEEIKFPRDEHR
jgi:hypothetical protein